MIDGANPGEINWQPIKVDLSAFANQEVTHRLYQRVFIPRRTAGNAYWKDIRLE